MLLAKVPRERAEQVRKQLFKRKLGAKDRRILRLDDHILIPLRASPPPSLAEELGIELTEGETMVKSCYRPPFDLVLEEAEVPEAVKRSLPHRWEMLGDVLILRLPDDIAAHYGEVARAYAAILGARTVLRERSHIDGVFRTPDMQLLLGDDPETVHLENGIQYKLDASRLMFSSGNIDEKMRMASLDCRGETVVDMFAGIGYFTLPLALHAQATKVIACEINPLAFGYLRQNITLNGLEGRVEPVLGDNRELPGEGIAERVVMGYVRTTAEHLGTAFRLVRKGGIIHYQDTFPLEIFPSRALDNLGAAAGDRGFEVILTREVKSYSPGVSHMVLDVRVLD
ncbi:MAG: class I SAM-dependent methyltransferase family protein [Methanomassiliicoccus sp.]|nr:class I SAM-dependent methyltransferase family protein [Methanomassiliicoccus sp.]